MKRIWHISDTHSYHNQLIIPENIDIVCFTGDESNYYETFMNEIETKDFLYWFAHLPIKHKIMIAGNHSAYAYVYNRQFRELCEYHGIIYLENEGIEIEDIKFWGSPVTPNFGNWYFMKDRGKLDRFWSYIPEDTDVLMVHGPPYNILDLSTNRDGSFDICGCKALRRHVLERIKPKLCLFGHIHNNKNIINSGTLKLTSHPDITFSNATCVEDGKFEDGIKNHGNIFEI